MKKKKITKTFRINKETWDKIEAKKVELKYKTYSEFITDSLIVFANKNDPKKKAH